MPSDTDRDTDEQFLSTRPGSRPLPTRPNLPPTTEGFAKFHLGAEIGRGGMGVVRRAEDAQLRRALAIKLLQHPENPTAVAQFIDEAQITGQLEHPNIVPVHELGIDATGRPWLAMKQVQGDTLREKIRQWAAENRRTLTAERLAERLDIFKKICDAVAFAHSKRVIHRDLKPENVMVGAFGEVLVMDWGLAKPLAKPLPLSAGNPRDEPWARVKTSRRDAAPPEGITVDGDVFGTPGYMAPEQARGDVASVDERSDVFGLGAILYHLLTLEPPYTGASMIDVLRKAAERALLPPRLRAPGIGIPRELEAIVMKAMAASRAERYGTVAALQADVAAFLAFRKTTAYRANIAEWIIKWTRRHPTRAAVGTLTVIFVAILAAGGSWAMKRHAEQERELEIQARLTIETREKNDALKRAAHDARLREMMQAGELENLRDALGVADDRRAIVREFEAAWNAARAARTSTRQFIENLPPETVVTYLDVFDRLFEAHRTAGVAVFADDYFFRGVIRHFARHEFAGAIADYSAALAHDDTHALARANRGLAHAEAGHQAEALADYVAVLDAHPHLVDVRINRGNLRAAMGDGVGALDDFSRAVAAAPRDPLAVYSRGLCRLLAGELTAALADFDTAISLKPDFAEAYANRAAAKLALGELASALGDYNRAIALDPKNPAAFEGRGQVFANRREFTAALADYDVAIELAPKRAETYICRGRAKAEMGDLAAAIDDFSVAIDLDGQSAVAVFNRATAHADAGNRAAALADFATALALVPHWPMALAGRAMLHLRGGDVGAAIGDYTAALDASEPPDGVPVDARLRARWANNRGVAWVRTGEVRQALADYDRAMRLDPTNAEPWFNRGNLYRQLSEPSRALADYSRAIDLDGTFANAYGNRAALRLETGDFRGAIADATQALALAPEQATMWANRGIAKSMLGDKPGAIADFQEAYRRSNSVAQRQQVADFLRQLGGRLPD